MKNQLDFLSRDEFSGCIRDVRMNGKTFGTPKVYFRFPVGTKSHLKTILLQSTGVVPCEQLDELGLSISGRGSAIYKPEQVGDLRRLSLNAESLAADQAV